MGGKPGTVVLEENVSVAVEMTEHGNLKFTDSKGTYIFLNTTNDEFAQIAEAVRSILGEEAYHG